MQEHSYRTGVLNNAQGYPSDACLPCLPTQESDNFSLIHRSGGDPHIQVTVSASRHGALAGRVRLAAPAGVTLEPAEWDVDLKAGGVSVTRVAASGDVKTGLLVRGEFAGRDGERLLRGQVPLYRKKTRTVAPGAVTVPAAKFSSEKGGNVKIEAGRSLAKDGCMLGCGEIPPDHAPCERPPGGTEADGGGERVRNLCLSADRRLRPLAGGVGAGGI